MGVYSFVVRPHHQQRREVIRLGMPAVGEQLLNLLVSLVDTYMVGHLSLAVLAQLGYTSDIALASVGLAAQLTWTLTTLFMAVALGCTVVVARFIGANDPAMANKALRQSLFIGVAMGSLGLILPWTFAYELMGMLGATDQVQVYGTQYLRIATLSFPLTALLFIGNAAFRGAGDTRSPLLSMGVVNGVNIVLSLILVNGIDGFFAGMGIAGAAWGTAIGQMLGGVLVLVWLIRGRSGLKLGRFPRPDKALIWRILRQGLPYGAEQFVFQAALLVFIQFINDIGTTAFAAHNIIITIESISFLPGMGIAVAATTLVGQYMGAEDRRGAVASGYESFRVGVILMGLIGILFILIPEVLLRFFVSNNPEVVEAAALPLRMVGFAQPALAANFIFSGALRGGGDPRWPLYVRLFSVWGVRLPLAWLFVYEFEWGLNGIWMAMITDFIVQGFCAWLRFRQGKWQTMTV